MLLVFNSPMEILWKFFFYGLMNHIVEKSFKRSQKTYMLPLVPENGNFTYPYKASDDMYFK